MLPVFTIYGADERNYRHLAENRYRFKGLPSNGFAVRSINGGDIFGQVTGRIAEALFVTALWTRDEQFSGEWRVRANTAIETGIAFATRGPSRVVWMVEKGIVLPSDLHQFGHVSFTAAEDFQLRLDQEIERVIQGMLEEGE
jgi:hypothetical protein